MEVTLNPNCLPEHRQKIKFQLIMEELEGIWRTGAYNADEQAVHEDADTAYCMQAEVTRWEPLEEVGINESIQVPENENFNPPSGISQKCTQILDTIDNLKEDSIEKVFSPEFLAYTREFLIELKNMPNNRS